MKVKIPQTFMQYAGKAPPQALEAMSNWLRIHAYLQCLMVSPRSLEIVGGMLVAEYKRPTGARRDIIARLYGRFNKLRFELERKEL